MKILKSIFHTKINSFWLYVLISLLTFISYNEITNKFLLTKNYWADFIAFMVIFYIFFFLIKVLRYSYEGRQHLYEKIILMSKGNRELLIDLFCALILLCVLFATSSGSYIFWGSVIVVFVFQFILRRIFLK